MAIAQAPGDERAEICDEQPAANAAPAAREEARTRRKQTRAIQVSVAEPQLNKIFWPHPSRSGPGYFSVPFFLSQFRGTTGRFWTEKFPVPMLENLFDPIFLTNSAWAQGTGVEPQISQRVRIKAGEEKRRQADWGLHGLASAFICEICGQISGRVRWQQRRRARPLWSVLCASETNTLFRSHGSRRNTNFRARREPQRTLILGQPSSGWFPGGVAHPFSFVSIRVHSWFPAASLAGAKAHSSRPRAARCARTSGR